MDKFEVSVGGKTVDILFPGGAGGGNAHVYVDRYYKGIFLKYQGKWEFRPQKEDHGFSDEEISGLIESIEEQAML